MNIQKEREAFENHLKKMGKTDNETFSKNEDDSYQMDIIHFGWKIWQAAKSQAVNECVWRGIYDYSVFESSCGHTFELSNDGTLDDNNMKHCCFCGGKIEAQEQVND